MKYSKPNNPEHVVKSFDPMESPSLEPTPELQQHAEFDVKEFCLETVRATAINAQRITKLTKKGIFEAAKRGAVGVGIHISTEEVSALRTMGFQVEQMGIGFYKVLWFSPETYTKRTSE